MIAKLARWLFFGAIISFAPLVAAYATLLINAKALSLASAIQSVSFAKVTAKGEVFLICGSLCAGALGELLGSTHKFKEVKIFAGGVAVVITFFCAYFFASIEAQLSDQNIVNQETLFTLSAWALALCILSSVSCLILSET